MEEVPTTSAVDTTGTVSVTFLGENRKFESKGNNVESIVSALGGNRYQASLRSKATGVEYTFATGLPPGEYDYMQPSCCTKFTHECLIL